MAGQAGVTEHAAANRLAALLKREQEVLMRARSAMSPETGLQFDAYLSILHDRPRGGLPESKP